MAGTYDVCVIGAGPGGYVAAIRAGQLGLKTVVVNDSIVGGVCLNWGCIPSKAIISTGKQVKMAQKGGRGIDFGQIKVNMPDVIKHKDGVVKQLTNGVAGLLKGNKAEHVQGRATFTAKDTIEVVNDGKKQTIKAKHFIVATGSSTIEIPGFKFDEKRVLSSTGALELQEVPKHLVVIGGGVIGLELACAYSNLGCEKVTVIEMMDQVVPGVDGEVAKTLARQLKKKGFDIHLGARAKEAKPSAEGVKVTFEAKGKETTLDADYCLVSVGRRPNTKDIGLEKAGVKLDERGFVVTDDQGRTNVPSIFAIGDITHGPMLAHKASKEGVVAAEAISGDKAVAKDWITIPGVIFTDPEIATAGLTEEQCKDQKLDYKVGKFNVGGLGKALADGETDGFYKIIGEAKSDKVLGVHIIGPHASDLISEAVLAMEMGATVEDVGMTVHPHPTLGEGLMEAAEALHGKSPHTINR
ncbi:MAG: dihydrolipoyl dehydrogenase [Thermoplasmatota archaeon]